MAGTVQLDATLHLDGSIDQTPRGMYKSSPCESLLTKGNVAKNLDTQNKFKQKDARSEAAKHKLANINHLYIEFCDHQDEHQ